MYAAQVTQADYFNAYLADPLRPMPQAAPVPVRPARGARIGRAPPAQKRVQTDPTEPYRDLDAGAAQAPLELPY